MEANRNCTDEAIDQDAKRRRQAEIVQVFINPVAASFRKLNDNEEAVKLFYRELGKRLEQFDLETLKAAAKHILDTRTEPFMPRIAECLQACQAIVNARQREENARKLDEKLEATRRINAEIRARWNAQ